VLSPPSLTTFSRPPPRPPYSRKGFLPRWIHGSFGHYDSTRTGLLATHESCACLVPTLSSTWGSPLLSLPPRFCPPGLARPRFNDRCRSILDISWTLPSPGRFFSFFFFPPPEAPNAPAPSHDLFLLAPIYLCCLFFFPSLDRTRVLPSLRETKDFVALRPQLLSTVLSLLRPEAPSLHPFR